MRVRLKGINSRRKALADGRLVTYWYAWKGGPRLEGKPGSAEFIASYNAAVATKRRPSEGVILSVLQGYQATDEFRRQLSERTRADYIRKIKLIEAEFGDFPLGALSDRRTRGEFMAWRDRLAQASPRQADYAWQVLALILSWALERGLIAANPCAKGGRLYSGTRRDKVWTDADEAAFYRAAPPHLHLALTLALWTGQRQGDLLRLHWAAYDGNTVRLRQSKGGERVVIPVGAPLRAALDATKRQCPVILVNSDGQPWTADGFRSSWRKACAAAGISGVTFNDLRGTAVTRLGVAEATVPQIAAITGHSLADVKSILEANYLHRDPVLAADAIRKLETRTKTPDRTPDRG
jgi:integrase